MPKTQSLNESHAITVHQWHRLLRAVRQGWSLAESCRLVGLTDHQVRVLRTRDADARRECREALADAKSSRRSKRAGRAALDDELEQLAQEDPDFGPGPDESHDDDEPAGQGGARPLPEGEVCA